MTGKHLRHLRPRLEDMMPQSRNFVIFIVRAHPTTPFSRKVKTLIDLYRNSSTFPTVRITSRNTGAGSAHR